MPVGSAKPLSGPEQAAIMARDLIGDLARENFLSIYTSSANCIIAYDTFTTGGIASVITDPSAVMRGAVMSGAVGLITAHNHPSGAAEPSPDDEEVWKEIGRRCKCLGIGHLDDLVITEDEFYSRMAGHAMGYGD